MAVNTAPIGAADFADQRMIVEGAQAIREGGIERFGPLEQLLIDAYNAQDIWNRRMGAGFRWTVVVSPDQRRAFDWLRLSTPSTAIVRAFQAHGTRAIQGSPGCVGMKNFKDWDAPGVEAKNLNLCTLRNIGIDGLITDAVDRFAPAQQP